MKLYRTDIKNREAKHTVLKHNCLCALRLNGSGPRGESAHEMLFTAHFHTLYHKGNQMKHNQKTPRAQAILWHPELRVCLSGVCQPPTAPLGLICGSLIHSRKAVIGLIYILLSFAAIAYDLLSFLSHMGGGLHTHLFMVNVKCHSVIKLTIWCINRTLQQRNAAMNEFHFSWSAAVACEERPKRASL